MSVIETSATTGVPEPTEEDLQAFHEAHQDRFTAPEYRALTFITLEPEDLVDEIEISEEQIEAEYQVRIESYRTPERRTVEQLLAIDRETIEAAARRLAEGESFAEVAEAMADQGVSFVELGSVTRSDLPGGLAAAVFAQPEGEVGGSVREPVRLASVPGERDRAGGRRAAGRGARRAGEGAGACRGARSAARRSPLSSTTSLRPARPLSEAAAAVGVTAKTLAAVDRQGRDTGGAAPADLPSWPELLEIAFATPEGEVSLLEETDSGQLLRGAGGQRDGAARQAGRGGARCAGGGLAGGATQSSSHGSGPRRCSAGPAR